jgi:hypothetical protein
MCMSHIFWIQWSSNFWITVIIIFQKKITSFFFKAIIQIIEKPLKSRECTEVVLQCFLLQCGSYWISNNLVFKNSIKLNAEDVKGIWAHSFNTIGKPLISGFFYGGSFINFRPKVRGDAEIWVIFVLKINWKFKIFFTIGLYCQGPPIHTWSNYIAMFTLGASGIDHISINERCFQELIFRQNWYVFQPWLRTRWLGRRC